jgi:class 3 adenylate cyclase
MFCDLVGSTEISRRLDPEEWRELVSEYHHLAAKAISRFGGHLAKYLGDGVMAYFGWPQAHDNDAERAVLAGLAIIDAVRAFNLHHAGGRPNLSVRIGMDTGTVVIGHGGGSASEVFGDTPNTAARAQSVAEPDTVLVTTAVHRLIAGLFIVDSRGEHRLKGIAHPVELYRVVRVSGARGRFAASAARGLTPLVGRAQEGDLLWKRWERAKGGDGQLVLIAGEAGIGKSRLLHHFRERVAHTPHTWNECAGVSHLQNTPFHPIADMLERAFAQRGENHNDKLAHLEGDLEGVGLPLGEAVPLLAPMARIEMDGKYEASKLSPQQQRERLLATLTEWLLGAARLQPLVIAVEDLHWFDASTLELIQLLAERSATSPVLLICTARPEFRAPWEPLTHHTHLALGRLAADHVRDLVNQVVATGALSREAIEHVVERTGGVPLFVEELTRAVVESGDAAPSEHAIPATLHDSLMARLDRLGGAKEIAQVASVIGREFSYCARPDEDPAQIT